MCRKAAEIKVLWLTVMRQFCTSGFDEKIIYNIQCSLRASTHYFTQSNSLYCHRMELTAVIKFSSSTFRVLNYPPDQSPVGKGWNHTAYGVGFRSRSSVPPSRQASARLPGTCRKAFVYVNLSGQPTLLDGWLLTFVEYTPLHLIYLA